MSKRTTIIASLALLSLVCTAAPVLAQEACGPQVQLESLDMTPLPGNARMTVPVSINGVKRNFLVATGAGGMSLTAAAAKSLGISQHYADLQTLLDFDGYASHYYYALDNVKIGKFHRDNFYIEMTPDPRAGADPPFDGIIAADLMRHFDVEMDFAVRKLNIFSPNHCPGRDVYWPATAIGIAPITLRDRYQDMKREFMNGSGSDPSELLAEGNILVPALVGTDIRTTVMLDGKSFTANIDTGEELSTLNTLSARVAYSVTADSPGSAPAGDVVQNAPASNPKDTLRASETVTVNGQKDVFRHTFHTLTFAGVTVTNPLFLVRPDHTGSRDKQNEIATGGHIKRLDDFDRPEITIGMNILKHLHLYFAFKEGRLYVTAADEHPPQETSVHP